ncbi:MAG: hypothetical protein ACR2MX_04510 [Cyclobacteriaceae bacterium]
MVAQETFNPREKALASASEAKELAAAQNWDEAIKQLEFTIDDLGNAPANASYRSYLYFNQGYIYEQRPGSNTTENLKLAQHSYQLALREKPESTKVLNNLILVTERLQDHPTALRYIAVMKELDTVDTYKWDLLAGDIHRDLNQPERAWGKYKEAIKSNGRNKNAARKIIDIYSKMPFESAKKLVGQCQEFKKKGMVEMARLGFEEILRIHCESQSIYFEEALLEWSGILAANGWVHPRLSKYIARLKCEVPALRLLDINVRQAWRTNPDSFWWFETSRRQFYYLALQKSWGDYLLSIGKKKQAMDLYLATRDDIRGIRDLSKEVYGRHDVLETEILVQLARLLSDKELNPDGRAFRRLEQELFEGKGQAYGKGDLPGIQKFHTILALIYVQRAQWEGGGARNAIFQLQHAISTSKNLARKDPDVYRPLPHLHRYLATAYKKTNNLERAADASLNAAVGYLETDNLNLSREMLDQTDSLNPYVKEKSMLAKKQAVNSIYQARSQVKDLDAEAFTVTGNKYYRSTATYEWLDKPNTIKGINSSVIKRQKFKVVSDLSEQAKKVGATSISNDLKNEALVNANQVKVLSSQQDVIRLRKIDVTKSNLINYESFPENDRQLQKEIKTGDKYLLPNQNEQMKRVIVPKREDNY